MERRLKKMNLVQLKKIYYQIKLKKTSFSKDKNNF